jgi:hypothetical protein
MTSIEFRAELEALQCDLTNRVSKDAVVEMLHIYDRFMQNGFEWTDLLPVMKGNAEEQEELYIASIHASIFYIGKLLSMTTNALTNESTQKYNITLEQCDKLFTFATELSNDFYLQFRLAKNINGIKHNQHIH